MFSYEDAPNSTLFFRKKALQIILTGVMLSLTKRRERHGILAGNENRILGRSACPVFTPHRGLRQGKRRPYGRNEKPHHQKKGSGRKILPYGQCLGTIPIQHRSICAATMYAPKGRWICLPKHSPAENISFSPCPTPQKPLPRHGQAVSMLRQHRAMP